MKKTMLSLVFLVVGSYCFSQGFHLVNQSARLDALGQPAKIHVLLFYKNAQNEQIISFGSYDPYVKCELIRTGDLNNARLVKLELYEEIIATMMGRDGNIRRGVRVGSIPYKLFKTYNENDLANLGDGSTLSF